MLVHTLKDSSDIYYSKAISLYESSFPENERRTIDGFYKMGEAFTFNCFIDKDKFIGILLTLDYKDIKNILYLAITPEYQNQGYGKKVLDYLHTFTNYRVIADLEEIRDDVDNNDQRIRRQQFYINNNFHPTKVIYTWQKELYTIYCTHGDITKKEFNAFWKHFN